MSDFIFVTKPDSSPTNPWICQEETYYKYVHTHSSTPFSIECAPGKFVYYYLNGGPSEMAGNVAAKMHNCRACIHRVTRDANLRGPDGWAVDFESHGCGGACLYDQIAKCRTTEPSTTTPITIVSNRALAKKPRKQGCDPETKELWFHLGIHPENHHITDDEIIQRIPQQMLSHVTNGSMDGLMEEILTHLNKASSDGLTDMDRIENAIKGDSVVRKSFWEYRLKYVRAIQKYAMELVGAEKRYAEVYNVPIEWTTLSPDNRIHIRLYALLYGGPGQWTSDGSNLGWRAARRVADVSKDATSIAAIPDLMNSMSDPATHLRSRVALEREKHNARNPISTSLVWNSRDDMDLSVQNERGQVCDFTNKWIHGATLKFDMNAGDTTDTPTESIDLTAAGVYKIYVTLYTYRDLRVIPYMVYVDINGVTTEYPGVWDYNVRGTACGNGSVRGLHGQQLVTTVHITQEMIDESKNPTMLSDKQANRLSQKMPKFKEVFGDFTSRVATETDMNGSVQIHSPPLAPKGASSASDGLNDLMGMVAHAKQKPSGGGGRKTIGDRESLRSVAGILAAVARGDGVDISVSGRGFAPAVVTRHSCGDCLTRDIAISQYQRNGCAPLKPDKDGEIVQCRFDECWTDSPDILRVTHITPFPTYNGYFLSVANTHLPVAENPRWVIAGGMYVTDLTPANHAVREIWDSLHTSVRPTESDDAIGIGIFVHSGTQFTAKVNGSEKSISV